MTIDLTKAQARAKAVDATINCELPPCPAFTRVSQNVAAVATLLDTLFVPSTNGADRVYHQLKDILSVAIE
jgi:hypothetical protein